MRVFNASGKSMIFRALIDQGSQASFITQKAVKLLRLRRESFNVTVVGIGGNEADQINSVVTVKFQGLDKQSPLVHLQALVMNKLTGTIPKVPSYVFDLSHIKGLKLADYQTTNVQPIDLLLGAEAFSLILKSGVKIGNQNEPVAQETTLGWIISGRGFECQPPSPVASYHSRCELKLDKTIRAFWEIEEVNPATHLSRDDQLTQAFFEETTVRRADGRYIVKIPFKNSPPDLGDTRFTALQCYRKLEARLSRNPEIEKMYHGFLKEYLDLGHMAPDDSFNDEPKQRCFLPHHPVIREASTTTKCRTVFNASAKSSNGNSLNDCMQVGPKLQTELFDVLLRWRMHKFVLSADIEKMFRQIQIAPEDTPYQCIFWKPPNAFNAQIFRLNTVTYGTAAAPYLSMRVLRQLADDERERFPEASHILKRDIYVDDTLFGYDSIEECRKLRDELIQLLRSGGFLLRKFESNCKDLLNDLPSELRARDLEKTFDSTKSTKVLGISWKSEIDCFSFQVQLGKGTTVTKRMILSCIASIFDPLGWVAPTVVKAKILMQSLWREELDWDTEVGDSLKNAWLEIKTDFHNLANISIPRWTGTLWNTRTWQLHGFSDASEKAYGAVVYLRSESESGPHISLLAAKTRVAPVKELSIPRLELSAAVLLSELMARVDRILETPTIEKVCWSDSTIVLTWLKADPSRWKKFVANRVSLVQETLPNIPWHYVPTKENPADLASRGVSAADLQSHILWWKGPSWLIASKSAWPASPMGNCDDNNLEKKTGSVVVLNSTTSVPNTIIERFSSYRKLLSFTANAYQWLAKARKVDPLPTQLQLVTEARIYWIKYIQQNLYQDEFNLLSKGHSVQKGALCSLDTFLDNDNIIRVGGRLANSDLPFAVRCPIILGSHPITKLIIQNIHEVTLHGGNQLMQRMIREKFWIIRVRDLVRSCIRNCVSCVRHRAVTGSQKMSHLPTERVTVARTFSKVGVDYAGPFFVRALPGRGRAARKGYISIFVCLITRAVDLEFVSDYSSETFLAAFRRFVSRRGLPALVMSDNGTTFQGAEKELRCAFESLKKDSSLSGFFAGEGIDWRFIPPNSPHFGGIWEAGVKSVKHHLRRVINTQTLTFEEMATLLSQIGACLNSRPIAPMSDNVDDFTCLTPGHFLSDGAPLSVPEVDLSELNENRLSRWQRVQQMRTQFQKLWRSDYLLTLQQRRKWRTSAQNLEAGDIVLLRNDNLPPGKWDLGRVLECYPDKDNLVRVVKVKTAKSIFNRSIHKLCLLPLRSAKSTEEFD